MASQETTRNAAGVRSVLTLGLLFASLGASQPAHVVWRRAELVAVRISDEINPINRDWAQRVHEYTLDDGQILYLADFGTKPLKSALHDPVQFTIQKERLVVIDKDQVKRTGTIRARVLKN